MYGNILVTAHIRILKLVLEVHPPMEICYKREYMLPKAISSPWGPESGFTDKQIDDCASDSW